MSLERQFATDIANGAQSPSLELTIEQQRESKPANIHSLYIGGTFGSGGSVDFELSLDNVTWFKVAGATAITVAQVLNLEFRANYCRINVTAGDGTTAIDAWLA